MKKLQSMVILTLLFLITSFSGVTEVKLVSERQVIDSRIYVEHEEIILSKKHVVVSGVTFEVFSYTNAFGREIYVCEQFLLINRLKKHQVELFDLSGNLIITYLTL
jgi:hypothetical protein